MKPRDAATDKKQLLLRSDWKEVASGFIIINGPNTIVLRNNYTRVDGCPNRVEFTHREFRALVDWFNRDQKDSK